MAGVTALFKSGAKTAPAKAKSIAKSATKKIQKSVPRPVTVKKEVKKALPKKVVPPKPLKKALPKAPPKPLQKAIPKPVAKKATQVVRKATSNVKKATSRVQYGGAQLDKWYGPSRALYLPGGLLDRSDIPTYLNGSLAGDYGYDPLELGKTGDLEKYRANELIHARWAMLGAAGAIIPEGLQANGADIKGGTWFETGAEMLNGGTLNYFAVPWTIVNNPLPLILVALIEVGLIGGAEKYRSEGQGPPGYSPGIGKFDSSIFAGLDNLYPGGPFDPLGLADDPETLQELKVKEIKNGRLAMISFLGFAVQAAVTGEGPYANWTKHLADPFGYNLLTILGAEERLPTL